MTDLRVKRGPWPRTEIAAAFMRHVRRANVPLADVAAATAVPMTVLQRVVSGDVRVPYTYFRPIREWVRGMDDALEAAGGPASRAERHIARKIAKGELPPVVAPAKVPVPFDGPDDEGPRGRAPGTGSFSEKLPKAPLPKQVPFEAEARARFARIEERLAILEGDR